MPSGLRQKSFGQNRCAVVPRGNIGATPSSCIFEEVGLRHHGGLLAAAVHIAKELPMTVLRQRMTEDMQVRNLSHHTQASYLQQVSLFARHFDKSPDVLTPEHIRTYQVYLTNERKLATGSIHIAVAALRFLYKITSSGNGPLRMCFLFPRSRRNCPSF